LELKELEAQVKVVSEARKHAEDLKDAKNTSMEQWQSVNVELLQFLRQANETVDIEEDELRQLTIKAYEETGNKAPVPGVGIREVTKLDYEQPEALHWAIEHTMALSLDKKAFEKIVKASPLPFVTITHPVEATIAQNLEEVLQ